jgi:hypothetical protein
VGRERGNKDKSDRG